MAVHQQVRKKSKSRWSTTTRTKQMVRRMMPEQEEQEQNEWRAAAADANSVSKNADDRNDAADSRR
jgi:hypothetical protein